MALLTLGDGSFAPSPRPPAGRRTGAAQPIVDPTARVRRACQFVLGVLLAGGALAAIIALKTVAFAWHLHA